MEPLHDSSDTPGAGCLDVYVVVVVPPDTYILPHSGHMAPYELRTTECAFMPSRSALCSVVGYVFLLVGQNCRSCH